MSNNLLCREFQRPAACLSPAVSLPPRPAHLTLAAPRSCATCPLLGSLTEAETGAVLELPLREHTELLSFLLSLRGSQPSLRQQRFTFQLGAGQLPALPPLAAAADPTIAGGAGGSWSSEAAGQQAAAVAPPTPPPRLAGPGPASGPVLTSRVFEEAPDPHALTDGSSAVAVLLPSEAGLPAQAFAGSEEVQVGAAPGGKCAWMLGRPCPWAALVVPTSALLIQHGPCTVLPACLPSCSASLLLKPWLPCS